MRMGGRQQQPIAASSCGTSSTNPRGAAADAVIGIRAITNKAPLTIRPFAAIYNPYSKGCSVLCNHPATPELKTVVKHAKQSWVNSVQNTTRYRTPGTNHYRRPIHQTHTQTPTHRNNMQCHCRF